MPIVTKRQRNRRVLTIPACPFVPTLALAAALSAIPAGSWGADPDRFAYDPSKCTADARGRRYIAMGATVLAILPDPVFLAGATVVDQKDLLIPPNPNDKPGCPDNPHQILVRFPLKSIFPNLAEASKDANIRMRDFGLAPMYGLGMGALNAPPTIPQVFRDLPGISDKTCNRAGASVIRTESTEVCRWPEGAAEPATAFNAFPPRYSTPAGDPFRVWCGPRAYDFGMTPCYVSSYATLGGVAIGYEFFPTVSIRTVNYFDQLIGFDRQIRAAVYAAFIADYPWPQRAVNNPERK